LLGGEVVALDCKGTHFVLMLDGDVFFDGNGVSTCAELDSRWSCQCAGGKISLSSVSPEDVRYHGKHVLQFVAQIKTAIIQWLDAAKSAPDSPIRLRDVVPGDFFTYYMNIPTAAFLDVRVASTHTCEPWPGRHKNVRHWWKLANGKLVGWNDAFGLPWSFPVMN